LWNNATQTSATQINVDHLTSSNIDIDVFLALITTGNTLIIQSAANSNNYQQFTVSAPVTVIPNDYVEIPVTYVGGGYSFANNDNVIFAFTATGSQGAQGPQGYQGAQGVQGSQGPQGLQGAQGLIGDQGTQGFQGSQGAVGLQGDQGVQGYQGVQGPQGFQGFQGPQGDPNGPQGAQGSQGTAGVDGPQGSQGPQGFQGSQGSQGAEGAQGVQGAQGAQGFQGSQGSIYYDVSGEVAGTPIASSKCLNFKSSRAWTLASSGSVAACLTAPTGNTDFDVQKNGVSIGTIAFTNAGTSGTVTITVATAFAAGDLLTVVAPAALNSISTPYWTFAGTAS
jgi:hypothetical protein